MNPPASPGGPIPRLTPDAPAPLRLAAYLGERFPPVAYTLLVGLFFGSAVAVAGALAGGGTPPRAWAGAAVLWLAFLHLRIFDEHKDYHSDVVAHPERLLSRGVVTLPLLSKVGLVAILVEGVLSGWIGGRAPLAWAVVLAFTGLMRFEFGVGGFLRRHILLYAVTHNPVVGLLAVYAWACTGLAWRWEYLAYVAAVSLGSLAFEIARKTRLPEEEIPGVESYSSVHGRGRVAWILRGLSLLTVACGGLVVLAVLPGVSLPDGSLAVPPGVGLRLGGSLGCLGLGLVLGLGLSGPGLKGKKVELGGTLLLLLTLLGILVAAW